MKIRVDLKENSYDIFIEKGILNSIGKNIKDIFEGNKVFIVTDENVNKYYGDRVQKNIYNEGYETKKLVLPAGETTKNIQTLNKIYKEMLNFSLRRDDIVIALGGGVIGDITGFASATFLRGVPYVGIPTSLLSQVDSSVGGKTAVDLPEGKNLVGAFYQPSIVFIDSNTLYTLENKYFIDGMGEVIKYSMIRDLELYKNLLNYGSKKGCIDNMDYIIHTCCNIKRKIVEKDEKDFGERMILNFGHTFGHAIETYYKFEKYSHGEAVALGMAIITKIGEQLGKTREGTFEN